MKKIKVYKAENEPVLGYKKGSEERATLGVRGREEIEGEV